MTHVSKRVEIIGSSEKRWSEAAEAALDEVKKTVHGITRLEVTNITAKVMPVLEKLLNIMSQPRLHLELIIHNRIVFKRFTRQDVLLSSL
ncbi:MAG: dodecin family protein [Thermoproteota archaeon]|nr:dodecin family protein [Thermoproteota archaeon]